MESEPIYELLEPGDVLILYKEKEYFLYAVNKDGGLTIERALIPPSVVRRSVTLPGIIMGIAAEPIVKGAIVNLDASSGMIKTASSEPEPKPDREVEEFEEYNGDPREFSDYFDYVQRKKERKEREESEKEESRAKRIVDEWRKKCEDCKKESDSWPGYLAVGTFKHCTP